MFRKLIAGLIALLVYWIWSVLLLGFPSLAGGFYLLLFGVLIFISVASAVKKK